LRIDFDIASTDFGPAEVKRGLFSFASIAIVVAGILLPMPFAIAGASSQSTRDSAGCVANPSTYPGKRTTDCVALRNSTVAVDNTIVKAKWALVADKFGFTNVCAAVSIKNQNRANYFFNDFNMTLRAPSGSVMVLNFTAKHPLNDGFIPNSGVAKGNICFDYSGQFGRYVAMYTPHPLTKIRGIWIFNIGERVYE
jgi:hypothetical protein